MTQPTGVQAVTEFVAARPDYQDEIHVEQQGSLMAVAVRWQTNGKPVGGRRSGISTFSKASRRRLLQMIARLNKTRTTFITLTYPEEFPLPSAAKEHLRAFLERIRRRCGWVAGIWRMELQERGAPHFHLLMFDLPFIDHTTLRYWWAEIIGTYHLGVLPFVRVELVKSWRDLSLIHI